MGKKTKTSFKPGAKPGPGRPAGSKNVKTLTRAEETMAGLGFNPVEFLVELAQNSKTRPDIKAKIGIELSSLINPKAKEPEDGDGDDDGDDDLGPEGSDEGKLLSMFKMKREQNEA